MKKVSIPYRYSKNKLVDDWKEFFKKVSIPYRYSKNRIVHIRAAVILKVSIPYRYSKNTISSRCKLVMPKGFNSL